MAIPVQENPPELYLPSDQPLGLLSPPQGLMNPAMAWCVVQTHANREKALAHYLHTSGIPYFLPLTRTNTPGTRNRVYRPLFAGILFMCHLQAPAPTPKGKTKSGSRSRQSSQKKGDPSTNVSDDYRRLDLARDSRNVYGFLFTKNQPRLRKELTFLSGNSPEQRGLRTEPLAAGTLVKVGFGPLAGLEVRLMENCPDTEPNKVRVQVSLELLGATCSRLVDVADLQTL